PGGGHLLGKEHAAQGPKFERAIKVDVLLALGVAISEMGMNVDEAWHHKIGGVVEHMVIARPPRRGLFRPGKIEHAVLAEHQGLALSGFVLPSGEQVAATDKGFHCRELPVEETWAPF